jgi:hypothetical protein
MPSAERLYCTPSTAHSFQLLTWLLPYHEGRQSGYLSYIRSYQQATRLVLVSNCARSGTSNLDPILDLTRDLQPMRGPRMLVDSRSIVLACKTMMHHR